MKKALLFVSLTFSLSLSAKTYYVAPAGGSDMNPGTIDRPWATWQKAFDIAHAGDTVYFRGGTWFPTTPTYYHPDHGHGHNGTRDNPICFFNYPGEVPILDCINYPTSSLSTSAFDAMYVTHAKFKGLIIQNCRQTTDGQWISGVSFSYSGNLWLDQIVSRGHGGTAFWLAGYDTLYLTNCDAYNNCDSVAMPPSHNGGRADGYNITSGGTALDTFKIGYIEGCRAWNCSDDGFDISSTKQLQIHNTWSWSNGRLDGDGTGFKFSYSNIKTAEKRKVYNCITAYNTTVEFAAGGAGFAELNLVDELYGPFMVYCNNTSYKDFLGFSSAPDNFECGVTPASVKYYNNIVYKPTNTFNRQCAWSACLYETPIYITDVSNNSFIKREDSGASADNPAYTVTDDDFVSLDTAQLRWPRKSDGSLPDITFMKLKEGSDLIDAGVDIGLPFYSFAPDMGYSEYVSGPYTPANQPPTVTILNPIKGGKYIEPANIIIEVTATDKDGTISKIEYYIGNNKLAEITTAPYTFTWKDVTAGTYSITAIATDNRKAITASSPISIFVETNATKIDPFYDSNSEIILLYPNPNNGIFTIDLADTGKNDRSEIHIISSSGKSVYRGSMLQEELIKHFDLSNLSSGLYIMILSKNGRIVTKKFLKG